MRPEILFLDDPPSQAVKAEAEQPFALLYGAWKDQDAAVKHSRDGWPISREFATYEDAMDEANYLQELYGADLVVTVVSMNGRPVPDAWDRVANPATEFE